MDFTGCSGINNKAEIDGGGILSWVGYFDKGHTMHDLQIHTLAQDPPFDGGDMCAVNEVFSSEHIYSLCRCMHLLNYTQIEILLQEKLFVDFNRRENSRRLTSTKLILDHE